MSDSEVELSKDNWDRVKEFSWPGDVLLLRHRPKKDRDCLLELIHVLDGPYDHAAVVRSNDRNGTVMIAHVTAASAVCESSLDDVIKAPGVVWVRAELRRRWPDAELDDSSVAKIAEMANQRAWPHAHYGFGDLLLAALAASRGSSARRRDDGRDIPDGALEVVRARLLALCVIDITDFETKEDTAGVTCASFVNSCHDDENQLRGPFPTIDERLKEFESSDETGANAAAAMIAEYRRKLTRPEDLHGLLREEVCLDAVGARDEVSDGQVTHLIIELLRTVVTLHEAVPAHAMAEGEEEEPVRDADRLLVSIEDLHTDENLDRVWVEPPFSCECERPRSPTKGVFHL